MKKIISLIKEYDLMILFICTLMIFISNLIALEAFFPKNRYIIILIFCIIIIWMNKKKIKITKFDKNILDFKKNKNNVFIVLWILFFIIVLISKFINKGSNILDVFTLLLMVPFFFFLNRNYKIEKYISLACLINLIPLLLILKPGNTLSMLITFIGVVFINMIIRKLADKCWIFTYIFIVGFFGILILITQCRSTLLAFAIVAVINYIYILTKNKMYKKKILATLLIVVCAFLSLSTIIKLVFYKYDNTFNNITTGRTAIWEKIVDDGITLFGHNDNFFFEVANKGDAHNVYFQALGHYGVISLILYGIINIYIVVKLITKKYKLEYINFFIIYFIIGMFENLLFMDSKIIISNLLLFMYIGMLLNDKKNEFNNKDNSSEKVIMNFLNKIK